MSNEVRFVIRYRGHVQGVGFRATAVSVAEGLSVNGFVRNENDGSVTLDADGTRADLQELKRRISEAMGNRIDDALVDQRDSQQRSDGFRIEW